jgi:hypothetical protein
MSASPSERLNTIARRLQLLIADAKAMDMERTVAALELAAFLLADDIKRQQQS